MNKSDRNMVYLEHVEYLIGKRSLLELPIRNLLLGGSMHEGV